MIVLIIISKDQKLISSCYLTVPILPPNLRFLQQSLLIQNVFFAPVVPFRHKTSRMIGFCIFCSLMKRPKSIPARQHYLNLPQPRNACMVRRECKGLFLFPDQLYNRPSKIRYRHIRPALFHSLYPVKYASGIKWKPLVRNIPCSKLFRKTRKHRSLLS